MQSFFNHRHLQMALCCTALAVVLTGCLADDEASSSAEPAVSSSVSPALPASTSPVSDLSAPHAADASEAHRTVENAAVLAKSAAKADSDGIAPFDAAATPASRAATTASKEAVSVSVMTSTTTHKREVITPQSALLTAGDIDDLRNFDFFRAYIQRTRQQYPEVQNQSFWPQLTLDKRITLAVTDKQGRPVANAAVRINAGTQSQKQALLTSSEGIASVFPALDAPDMNGTVLLNSTLLLTITTPEGQTQNAAIPLPTDQQADVSATITLNHYTAHTAEAMDIMFVIDATGSMGDEIRYLQTEFDGIVSRLSSNNPQVSLRYGLVMYRDIGDDYVVHDYGFTSSAAIFRKQLSQQRADGGGDYPEAMEQALDKAVNAHWRDGNTARVMFLVADAPPHDENLARAFESFKTARTEGIRLYPVGASGVADTAEYLMRTGAVLTQGRYLFLTDDSGIGNAHAEPKVPCYVVTSLNSLIERVLASELRGMRVEPPAASILREVGRYDQGVCR
jgi:Mg-chelatase subunit ChlD